MLVLVLSHMFMEQYICLKSVGIFAYGVLVHLIYFLSAMNATLQPVLRKCALVLFDDILVYSPSFVEHLKHFQIVLQLLSQNNWKVNTY